ncbi:hypothetical protein nbrc107696_33810 [Gordonia spumicola]|uniref:Uncharacterized protein n=1 Tax=Gordonia spumicola TaxID=589161 RepID=A0A7I9VC65_9ACTN|nr:hypothetical protein [Gordonia spumicola]GEE02935.1 hypothetical protein nbrc107696_33810 [Gordonia spumicola]
MRKATIPEGTEPHQVVGYLKERVYVAFTGLAIVLAMSFGESDHRSSQYAFTALLLGVVGVTSAASASDVIAHLAVHKEFPDRHELFVITKTTLGALSSAVVPAALIGLSWLGVFSIDTALLLAGLTFVVALGVVVWLAVRNADITGEQQLAALAIILGIGLLVLAAQVLAKAG